MADIYFYQQCDPEDETDGGSTLGGETNTQGDDGLHPIAKLEKFAASENIFNRQMVARTVLETLRQVEVGEMNQVFNVMDQLAGDTEPSVRAELMEQVPHIAMFCQELPSSAGDTVPVYLLPLVVRFLTDTNNQVRKTSQAALLVLLEQGLADTRDVEDQVCPVILGLTEAESDDLRTEAVALLSKMAPLIGQEMSERLFLQRFATLSADPLFHVRKVCAANFGDFSGVVGSEATEQVLLPKFFYLCEDGVWGVRKACADVFMPVSCVCSPTVRQSELSPLFLNLLRDQSRWVRMAAFQALGPFISTFADPEVTALLRNENGEIVVTDTAALSVRLAKAGEGGEDNRGDDDEDEGGDSDEGWRTEGDEMDVSEGESWGEEATSSLGDRESPEELRAQSHLASWPGFSAFLYWREPVADLPDDLFDDLVDHQDEKINDGKSTEDVIVPAEEEVDKTKTTETIETGADQTKVENVQVGVEATNAEAEAALEGQLEILGISEESKKEGKDDSDTIGTDESPLIWKNEKVDDAFKNKVKEEEELKDNDLDKDKDIVPGCVRGRWQEISTEGDSSWDSTSSQENLQDQRSADPCLPRGPPETEQCIVPQLLIDHYVSMVDPSRAQTVDNDIARHCAFSLPAVALTLGRANWPLLKETYESLANDMQWKVRRTLANSIHELAVILGPEVASQDLVPIFNGFIKDLDEVRIGVLKHLADFLSLLSPEARAEYLPRLEEFLKMDNDRNWRFRLELCNQVAALVPLCSSEEVLAHLAPLCLLLVNDRVSEVRRTAAKVTASLLAHLSRAGEAGVGGLAMALVSVLARDNHWARRQTFVLLCAALQGEEGGLAVLTSKLLPPLLLLADDPVPNVRLSLASLLHSEAGQSLEGWSEVLARLLDDTDRDVRAAGGAEVEPPLKLKGNKLEAEISTA